MGVFGMHPRNLDWVAATLTLARAFANLRAAASSVLAPARNTTGPMMVRGRGAKMICCGLHRFTVKPKRVLPRSCRHFSDPGDFLCLGPHVPSLRPAQAPGRLVASVARALIIGDRAVCGAGHVVRDFMPVEQAGAALAMLIESNVQGPVNVATGRGTSVETIAHLLGEISGQTRSGGLRRVAGCS